MRIRKITGIVALVAASAMMLTACEGSLSDFLSEGGSAQSQSDYDLASLGSTGSFNQDVSGNDVIDNINSIRIAQSDEGADYSRDLFKHWSPASAAFGFDDPDLYGCDTRTVVMWEDGTDVLIYPDNCFLEVKPGGGWLDQYGFIDRNTGEMKPYKFMTQSKDVDMEHIVALKEAWRSGADKMTPAQREAIANDRTNLVISDPSANRSKGDQDASTYLPPGNFRCEYIDRYAQVKVKFDLTADQEEIDRLLEEAQKCAA